METDAPPHPQDTDADGGLSTAEIGLIIGLTLSFITLLFGSGIIWRLKKYIINKRRKRRSSAGGPSDQRSGSIEAGVDDSLLPLNTAGNQAARNSTGAGASGSEGNVTVVDQSPNHQGCGEEQAAEAERSRVDDMEACQSLISTAENVCHPQLSFYDIYLVSTSKDTPHVQKMKDMCERNGWTFTTPFTSKLGEPVMKSIEDAVLTCTHVVLILTEEDVELKDNKYSMTYEMALATVENGYSIGGKVIPILCCDSKFLALRLTVLRWSHIDDGVLEERMRKTIDKSTRVKREASLLSGASAMTDEDAMDLK